MITKVSLRGFQSHVSSEFNLHEGLNVITGPSDAGKTAIIRAVRWVAFNEPQGEAFVNENVGEAEIKIHLANKAIITKTRKKSKTSYLIQTDETDEGSLFEKSEVPFEVKSLLGIEKHSFGDFEAALNFSFQLDAPFLISETASAGAKVLGKLAGTESVDRAIKGVSKDTYAARNLRAQAEKDMERIVGNLFEYEGIDDAKQMLETAEMILEQVEASKDKFDFLKTYRHEYLLAREKIRKLFETLNKLTHVPDLEEDLQDIEKSQQRYDSLLQLYSDGSRLQQRIDVLGQEITKYQEIESAADLLNSIVLDVDQLTNNIIFRQSYQKHTDDVKRTSDVLEKVKEIDTAAEDLNVTENNLQQYINLRTLKAEYHQTFLKLRESEARLKDFEDLSTADEYLHSLAGDVDWLGKLNNLQEEQKTAEWAFSDSERIFQRKTNILQGAQEDVEKAWEAAGGICPLCEQFMTMNHAH